MNSLSMEQGDGEVAPEIGDRQVRIAVAPDPEGVAGEGVPIRSRRQAVAEPDPGIGPAGRIGRRPARRLGKDAR
jgi:hypothetical protein